MCLSIVERVDISSHRAPIVVRGVRQRWAKVVKSSLSNGQFVPPRPSRSMRRALGWWTHMKRTSLPIHCGIGPISLSRILGEGDGVEDQFGEECWCCSRFVSARLRAI